MAVHWLVVRLYLLTPHAQGKSSAIYIMVCMYPMDNSGDAMQLNLQLLDKLDVEKHACIHTWIYVVLATAMHVTNSLAMKHAAIHVCKNVANMTTEFLTGMQVDYRWWEEFQCLLCITCEWDWPYTSNGHISPFFDTNFLLVDWNPYMHLCHINKNTLLYC